MFEIYDGRDKFYQWDKNRKLIVKDPAIKEVHFANCLCRDARVCLVNADDDGVHWVHVPNQLLTEYVDIRAWAYDGEMTKHEKVFEVVKRTKPSDYIYTPEELKTWEELSIEVNTLNMTCDALTESIAGVADETSELSKGINEVWDQMNYYEQEILNISDALEDILDDEMMEAGSTWSSHNIVDIFAKKVEISKSGVSSIAALPTSTVRMTTSTMPAGTSITFYQSHKNLLPFNNDDISTSGKTVGGVQMKRSYSTERYSGTLILSGVASGTRATNLGEFRLPAGTYTYSLGDSPNLGELCYGQIYYVNDDGTVGSNIATYVGYTKTHAVFTLQKESTVRARIYWKAGASFSSGSGYAITPYIEAGDNFSGQVEPYQCKQTVIHPSSTSRYSMNWKMGPADERGMKYFYCIPDNYITYEYYEDPQHTIESLTNAIISLGGNV